MIVQRVDSDTRRLCRIRDAAGSLRRVVRRIDSDAALDEALRAPLFLLFKHSTICGVSTKAWREYEVFLETSDVETGFINVIDDRPLSQRAAELTGVPHKSPQVLLLKDGEVVWHTSHFKITDAALHDAVTAAG